MRNRFVAGAALGLLSILALGAPQAAEAQEVRIGYTDHEIIIVNMPAYQEIRGQLEEEYAGSQEALQSLASDFQADVEKYQKQQALLSEERRVAREQELAQQQNEIQQAAMRKDQELAEREAELMAPLLERVQAAIDEVATEQNLDIVLRHQVGTQPLILFVNQDKIVNITLDVAKKLGIDTEVEEEQGENSGSVSSSN